MKLSKKDEKELMNVYGTWWNSYLNGDVKTYDFFFTDDYHFVGSTNGEEFLDRKDTTAFFQATADQLAGKAELRNLKRWVEELEGGIIIITDLADAYVLSETGWVFYSRFRFTSMLRKSTEGWRFFYQHFSAPDSKAQEGETLGTEKITKENEELRDAIKRRTIELEHKNRELAIEAALERIRAKVTSMQESVDLLDIVVAMRNEFVGLGHDAHYFWYMRWLPDKYEKAMTSGDGTRIGMVMDLPRHIHGDIKLLADWEKSEEPAVVFDMDVNTAVDYVEKMIHLGDFKQVDPSAPTLDDIRHIGGLTFVMARSTYGEIGYSLPGVVPNPPMENVATLVRFAGVFDLAYRRFEDLKQAEKQNRETKIELALERVRSRTMGMHKSGELKEVIQVVYEQFVHLNINVDHAGFIMDYKERNDMHIWLADQHEVPFQVTIPYFDCAHWNSYIEAKEKNRDFFANHLNFEEKNRFYEHLFTLFPVPDEAKEYYFNCPGLAISTVLLESIGLYIENFSGIPYNDEENKILMRFGKVFQQTYTRFLDLQKAERQARESQIEAAMEKVRSRALSMHKPDELIDVAKLLRKEMSLLGVEELETSSIYIHHKDTGKTECWFAIKNANDPIKELISDTMTIDLEETAVGRKMLQFYCSDENKISLLMKGEERNEWINYCAGHAKIFGGSGFYGEVIPERTYHLYKFSNGYLGASSSGDISLESWDLLHRATAVFSLAYTRFNDLHLAEAHAEQAELDLQRLKTEKKRTEDALAELQVTQKQLIQSEKMASLGELTAGIAHEIQNPLNFVNNFSDVSAELLDEMNEQLTTGNWQQAREIAGDVKQNLEKILHHGKRADEIVKGMLQHSRSGSGQKEPTDLNMLSDEYLRLAFHGWRAKDKSFNAVFKTELDNSLGKVEIIPQDIGRVLVNLINNAFYAVNERRKNTTAGYEACVIVSTKNLGDHLELRVIDNGNGISPQVLDKIFQPFFTTKPTGQGTGLGLSLSYDIIKAHGGELRVETKQGEGSTFIIDLPERLPG